MPPEVRYFTLADLISTSQNNLQRVNIMGLLTHLRVKGTTLPVVHPRMDVLALLTNGTGSGDLSLRIVFEPTAFTIFRTPSRRIRFSGAPNEVVGPLFHVRDCSYPSLGLYFVECVFDGAVIARQPLTLTR